MDATSPDQDLLRQSRRAWGALETVHVIGYFAEETTAEYVALGLHDRLAYFPARAAALGAVGPRGHRGHVLRLRALAARRGPARRLGNGHPGADGAGRDATGWPRRWTGSSAPRTWLSTLALARRLCEGLDLPRSPVVRCSRPARVAGRRPRRALARSDAGPPAPWRRSRGGADLAGRRPGRGDPRSTAPGRARSGSSSRPGAGATRSSPPAADRLRDRGWFDEEGALTDDGKAARDELESATDAAALAPWEAFGPRGHHPPRRADGVRLRRAVLDGGVLPRSVAASKVSSTGP